MNTFISKTTSIITLIVFLSTLGPAPAAYAIRAQAAGESNASSEVATALAGGDATANSDGNSGTIDRRLFLKAGGALGALGLSVLAHYALLGTPSHTPETPPSSDPSGEENNLNAVERLSHSPETPPEPHPSAKQINPPKNAFELFAKAAERIKTIDAGRVSIVVRDLEGATQEDFELLARAGFTELIYDASGQRLSTAGLFVDNRNNQSLLDNFYREIALASRAGFKSFKILYANPSGFTHGNYSAAYPDVSKIPPGEFIRGVALLRDEWRTKQPAGLANVLQNPQEYGITAAEDMADVRASRESYLSAAEIFKGAVVGFYPTANESYHPESEEQYARMHAELAELAGQKGLVYESSACRPGYRGTFSVLDAPLGHDISLLVYLPHVGLIAGPATYPPIIDHADWDAGWKFAYLGTLRGYGIPHVVSFGLDNLGLWRFKKTERGPNSDVTQVDEFDFEGRSQRLAQTVADYVDMSLRPDVENGNTFKGISVEAGSIKTVVAFVKRCTQPVIDEHIAGQIIRIEKAHKVIIKAIEKEGVQGIYFYDNLMQGYLYADALQLSHDRLYERIEAMAQLGVKDKKKHLIVEIRRNGPDLIIHPVWAHTHTPAAGTAAADAAGGQRGKTAMDAPVTSAPVIAAATGMDQILRIFGFTNLPEEFVEFDSVSGIERRYRLNGVNWSIDYDAPVALYIESLDKPGPYSLKFILHEWTEIDKTEIETVEIEGTNITVATSPRGKEITVRNMTEPPVIAMRALLGPGWEDYSGPFEHEAYVLMYDTIRKILGEQLFSSFGRIDWAIEYLNRLIQQLNVEMAGKYGKPYIVPPAELETVSLVLGPKLETEAPIVELSATDEDNEAVLADAISSSMKDEPRQNILQLAEWRNRLLSLRHSMVAVKQVFEEPEGAAGAPAAGAAAAGIAGALGEARAQGEGTASVSKDEVAAALSAIANLGNSQAGLGARFYLLTLDRNIISNSTVQRALAEAKRNLTTRLEREVLGPIDKTSIQTALAAIEDLEESSGITADAAGDTEALERAKTLVLDIVEKVRAAVRGTQTEDASAPEVAALILLYQCVDYGSFGTHMLLKDFVGETSVARGILWQVIAEAPSLPVLAQATLDLIDSKQVSINLESIPESIFATDVRQKILEFIKAGAEEHLTEERAGEIRKRVEDDARHQTSSVSLFALLTSLSKKYFRDAGPMRQAIARLGLIAEQREISEEDIGVVARALNLNDIETGLLTLAAFPERVEPLPEPELTPRQIAQRHLIYALLNVNLFLAAKGQQEAIEEVGEDALGLFGYEQVVGLGAEERSEKNEELLRVARQVLFDFCIGTINNVEVRQRLQEMLGNTEVVNAILEPIEQVQAEEGTNIELAHFAQLLQWAEVPSGLENRRISRDNQLRGVAFITLAGLLGDISTRAVLGHLTSELADARLALLEYAKGEIGREEAEKRIMPAYDNNKETTAKTIRWIDRIGIGSHHLAEAAEYAGGMFIVGDHIMRTEKPLTPLWLAWTTFNMRFLAQLEMDEKLAQAILGQDVEMGEEGEDEVSGSAAGEAGAVGVVAKAQVAARGAVGVRQSLARRAAALALVRVSLAYLKVLREKAAVSFGLVIADNLDTAMAEKQRILAENLGFLPDNILTATTQEEIDALKGQDFVFVHNMATQQFNLEGMPAASFLNPSVPLREDLLARLGSA